MTRHNDPNVWKVSDSIDIRIVEKSSESHSEVKNAYDDALDGLAVLTVVGLASIGFLVSWALWSTFNPSAGMAKENEQLRLELQKIQSENTKIYECLGVK